MEKNNNSYRQIFKATSIFGGVQVFNIIIAIVRSKIIAILLGPGGMGLVSLFTTTLGLIAGITNFGLGTSAVKNIATAASTGDENKLAKTVISFRKLVLLTGSFGFAIVLIFAPWLSDFAFGNKSYSMAFVLLSITLLFNQITSGQNVILQGLRKIQYMAKSSIIGALIGLLVSIPLYYFFGKQGIVSAIIISSICTLVVSWLYARLIKIKKLSLDSYTFKSESKEMLKMGFLISMSSVITLATSYLVRIFINKEGGLVEVGLFTAGFSIVGTYVGMVFAAMATDYYPRLSAISRDNILCKNAINQQAEIALLILSPILIILLIFVRWGVVLLYSKEFLGLVTMVHWAIVAIYFKATSWSIGFVFLAKGDSTTYFWNEFTANLYMLIFNILGYKFGGLTGIGISYLLSYILYLIQVYYIANVKFKFRFERNFYTIFIAQLLLGLICFITVSFSNKLMVYMIGAILIIVSCYYSCRELDKRIGIKGLISNKLKK